MAVTKAHDQKVTHSYQVHYPDHYPRPEDPHYIDFEHYRKAHIKTAVCAYAATSECHGGLELHHRYVEFSLQNGVDITLLEKDFPGISDPTQVGAWVESDENFEWFCAGHHRGHGGVHVASASDFQAEKYVKGLIS